MSDALQHFLIANVDLHEEIGRGGNGVVYRGSWQGASCAVKKMEFSEIQPKDRERMKKKFMTECERSSALRHPNIVQFLGVHIAGDAFPSLVMERLYSNLTDLLIANPKVPLEMKFSFLHDVAKGLNYLHTYTPPIIHRDLSTNNVLVSAGMVAKIGDLGTMHFVDGQRLSQMTREARTADFMPPEVLFDKPVYSTAMDVFSFACVCVHTLSHKWPTPSQPVETVPDSQELKPRSEAQRRAAYMEGIDDDIRSLATSCLNNSAEKRPSISEVCTQLEHIVTKQQFAPSVTLLDTHLSIEARSKEIEKLKEEINFKDGQIASLQELTNERESELETMRMELANKDAEIQQNTATIQQQSAEIERLKEEIRKKDQEIERRGVQIAEQQAAINELEAKLPSRDVMQLSDNSTNYWEGLKTTWSKVADLPVKLMTCCAVEMDGDVYISGRSQSTHFINVLHYSQADNSWSILNHLPCTHSSLAVVRSKSQLIAVGGIYPDVGDDINFEEDMPSKLSSKVLTWDAQMECWVNTYPDMPTARCSTTAVGHDSTVIVAGGVTGWEPTVTSTSVVEVMTVNDIPLRSEWTTVQSLPYPSSFALPMIIGNQLYIASGYSGDKTTCGVVTAAVSKLVTSKKDDTIFVWEKMSDLPHDSLSVGECDGRLVVFGGKRKSGTLDDGQLQYKVVSPIHLYNAETDAWDYVGHIPKEYCYWLGCAVRVEQNKLLFVGGATDPNEGSHDAYLTTCALLTITN